ncbi:MAG: RimJ/RimL family protein N-acetyltransferase [Cryomorphaceae bacterium]|jgi:RimJ/RimL family protein N-acetyltransferase
MVFSAELRDTRECIGFIGVNYSASCLPFAPCSDIGWRLAQGHWGEGYATEGAQASLHYVFEKTGLSEVVSMTPVLNKASERVMQKLGLIRQSPNIVSPGLAQGHSLAEPLLYKINKREWLTTHNRTSGES